MTGMSRATASERHDTHGKAFALDLDESIYGTLAEIDAGRGLGYRSQNDLCL